MNLETWSQVIIGITAIIFISCLPLAYISIRQDRRIRRERELREIARTSLEVGQSIRQEGARRRAVSQFVRQHLSVSTFGDKRRATAPLAEFLKPETGPIPLPDEHVPVS